jgi:hypothetical protein
MLRATAVRIVLCGSMLVLTSHASPSRSAAQQAAPKGTLSICHVASPEDKKDKSGTLSLASAVAKKHLSEHKNDFSGTCEGSDFVMVAVSGTLEEGFPLRPNLDFVSPLERVNAVFLGHALIRGLRAKLDMKDPASREFKAPPERAPVNPALVPTGDALDANISSIYLVDRRQAAKALLNEPRFLSMVPDLAKVDIAAPETDAPLRALLLQAIKETPGVTNTQNVTFLQVITTWDSCHFIPSPVLYTKPDGTRVTDFPNSLAAFASTRDETRTADPDKYYAAVEKAVRSGVASTQSCSDSAAAAAAKAKAPASYGVDKTTKRMIDIYRPCAFEELAARAGQDIQLPQCPN